MDAQELKDKLTERISQLDIKKNEALIEFGKALGAAEECQFILNYLNETEGAGKEPAPITEELLDPFPPQITRIESPDK